MTKKKEVKDINNLGLSTKLGAPYKEDSTPEDRLSEADKLKELDIAEINNNTNKWSVAEKTQAVQTYMITGSMVKTAEMVNIPRSTLRWWKRESTWWPVLMGEQRKAHSDKMDAQFSQIMEDYAGNILERLVKGDEVLDREGNINYRKPSARDSATILGIVYDKRALSRGDPTSRTGKTEGDAVKKLAQQFENFATQMRDRGDTAKVIEGTIIEDDE